jgi:cyclophilin family peptidyl-prolyl cis-trans isomerase
MKNIFMIVLLSAFFSFNALYAQNESKKETIFVIKTKYGNITCKLYNDTPKHRDNFIKLINEGWYEGSRFHRVIKDFMIQGGASADGQLNPGYRIPAEILPDHFHKRGVIAAARMGDQVNPERMSSGCQFYIVQGRRYPDNELDAIESRTGTKFSPKQHKVYTTLGGTPHLDGAYTIFGEVLSGMNVVDKITNLPLEGSTPVNPVIISIEIVD